MARSTSARTGGDDPAVVIGMAIMWAVFLVVGVVPAALLFAAVWFPMFSLPIAGAVAAGWYLGWPVGAGIGAVSVAAWVAWPLVYPASFRRWVSARWRWRAWWRLWMRYHLRWGKVATLNGLVSTLDGKTLMPALRVLRLGDAADELRVKLIDGQTVDDIAKRSDALRHSFRAVGVRVSEDEQPGWARLEVVHRDLLRASIPLPPLREGYVDLSAVPVGMSELGALFALRLYGGHLLIASKTGGGKSNCLRCVLAALGPMIRDGLVVVWCMDLKMGMEFSRAEPLFTRFAYRKDESAVAFLRDLVALVETRGERFRLLGIDKMVEPTREDPFVVVILDELASLTAYLPDKRLREEAEALLGRLMSVGRAPGVCVIGTVQDPSKEIVSTRQLFPYRLAFKLDEPTQIAMVFGRGARERGAACDRIRESTPGVGYFFDESRSGFTRVRLWEVTTADLGRVVDAYRPRGGSRSGGASVGGLAVTTTDTTVTAAGSDRDWLRDWGHDDGDGQWIPQ